MQFLIYIIFLIFKGYISIILRSKEQNTIIGGQVLYNILLASTTHQHEQIFSLNRFSSLLNCIQLYHSSVHLLSRVWLFATPWTAAYQATVHYQLPELAQTKSIESMMPSNHFILCHPLLLPSVFSSIRVFSKDSVLLIMWPKDCSFSFSISLSS